MPDGKRGRFAPWWREAGEYLAPRWEAWKEQVSGWDMPKPERRIYPGIMPYPGVLPWPGGQRRQPEWRAQEPRPQEGVPPGPQEWQPPPTREVAPYDIERWKLDLYAQRQGFINWEDMQAEGLRPEDFAELQALAGEQMKHWQSRWQAEQGQRLRQQDITRAEARGRWGRGEGEIPWEWEGMTAPQEVYQARLEAGEKAGARTTTGIPYMGVPKARIEATQRGYIRQQFGYKELAEMGEIIPELREMMERLETEWVETGGPEGAVSGATERQNREMTIATQAQALPEYTKLRRQYEEEMFVEYPELFPVYLDYKNAMGESVESWGYDPVRGILSQWTFKEWLENTPSAQAFLREKEEREREQEEEERVGAERRHRPARIAPIRQRA